jgi:hypothetical protein
MRWMIWCLVIKVDCHIVKVMYGPPCYVNEHIWLKKLKMTCAKMTNLACGN